jgi:hypothetical protein
VVENKAEQAKVVGELHQEIQRMRKQVVANESARAQLTMCIVCVRVCVLCSVLCVVCVSVSDVCVCVCV